MKKPSILPLPGPFHAHRSPLFAVWAVFLGLALVAGCSDSTKPEVTCDDLPVVAVPDYSSTCQAVPLNIEATLGGSATGGTWSGGTGSFGDASNPNTTYTPSGADASAGSVTLTFTTNASPPCPKASDSGMLTFTYDPGTICTWAGTGVAGFDGGGRARLDSHLYWPADVTFSAVGTYIVDWNNHVIREVVDGKLVTRIGTSIVGDGPFPGSGYSDLIPPGAPGTEVSLNHPTEILPMSDGKMLLMSWHNHKLRTYDPATGLTLVVCGSSAGFGGDGGPAADALLSQPQQGAIDSQGNIYILDQRNQRIRRIESNDIINTVAGTGVAGFSGDGGDPLQAQFDFPAGGNPPPAGAIVCDGQNRLYVSDTNNHRVRRIDFGANTIETVAGNGNATYGGDGGQGVAASLNNPRDLEFGPDGRLYIADELNNRVRALDLDTGVITTVAGNGEAKFAGDGGMAVDASLNRPAGLGFDDQGRLYIVDTYNHRIRRVTL